MLFNTNVSIKLATLLFLAASAVPAGADEAAPVRVATLVPYVADALVRVPTHAHVVARTRRSMTEAVPPGVVDLGSPHAPSFERLAEARPQLIVADEAMHAALQPQLARGGATVILVDGSTVDATLAGLVVVGGRVGAAVEMQREVDGVRRSLGALKLAEPVQTLPLFGTPAGLLVVTDRTWLGDALGQLGFTNVAGGLTGTERVPGYAAVSDEVMATLRPALVVIVAHGDADTVRRAFLERSEQGGPWAALGRPADGVHVLDPALFGANPGLDLPEAGRRLHALVRGG